MSDKSGAGAISVPKGGGAVTGMGEKFSPDLFTGTGNFSVPLALPAGRNGLQPELTLGYSTGGGNSAFGLGWGLGVPGVQRKTAKGIPHYDDARDVFILSGAEDLVPIARLDLPDAQVPGQVIGHKTQYRPRTEGLFARIEHYVYQDGRNYWQVRSQDGLTSYYGSSSQPVTVAGPAPDHAPQPNPACPAVLPDPLHPARIFAWHLTRTVDVFGNEIVYEYERELSLAGPHQYAQTYLRRLRYADYRGPAAGPTSPAPLRYLCSVELEYSATRPDPFSTYDSGFEQRTTRRCVAVRTYTHPETADLPAGYPAGTDPLAGPAPRLDPARNGNRLAVKTFALLYADQEAAATQALNGASLLHQVQVLGHTGAATEAMPPLEFGYSTFAPDLQRFFPVGGSLPSTSLADNNLELISIFGNGLPDLVQLAGGQPRYWRNLGQGRFAEPRPMQDAPGGLLLADPDVQFIDATGDGKPDLLVNRPGLAGYFSLNHQGQWDRQSFRPLRQTTSFSLADPEVKLLDLDGDGVTDVLRNGSRFEYFYNDPEQGFGATQQVAKSQLNSFPSVSFQDPRVRLAHLCSGLLGIAMVHNGRVEYWPNLGRGRWGQRVAMANSPVLPRGYNPAHILLGDVDGDGLDDFIYVEHNKITLWLNQSGNGWSAPITIAGTPAMTDASAVRVVDLLGTGTAGVLWTRDAQAVGRQQQYLFLDLTGKVKPYVLHEMDNHLGALTRVGYAPSTTYYLADQQKVKTRWQTPLPMPVQVVAQVEVIDRLSGGKMTTEYSYHHGYWDGGEREFRGFGRVDQRDTQAFGHYNSDSLFGAAARLGQVRVPGDFASEGYNNGQFSTDTWVDIPRLAALATAPTPAPAPGDFGLLDFSGIDFKTTSAALAAPLAGGVLPVPAADFAPPLETRTWFHLGPVGDGTGEWRELDLSAEYWGGDAPLLARPAAQRNLLRSLPRRQRRDAVRTLRGSTLRTELYARDGSARQHRPYTVTESLPGVARVRGQAAPAGAAGPVDVWLSFEGTATPPSGQPTVDFLGDRPIFFPYGLGQRTTQWERGDDPMTQLSFAGDYDSYGHARRQLSVALPRGWARAATLDAPTAPSVTGALVTLGLSQHAGYDEARGRNAYDTATQYLVGRASSSTSWEVKVTDLDTTRFALTTGHAPDWQALVADGLALKDNLLPRALLAHAVQYYDGPAFVGEAFGRLGTYGALTRSEVLVLTPAILTAAYGPDLPPLLQAGPSAQWPGGWPAEYPAAFRTAYDAAYPAGAAGYHLGTGPEYVPGGYYQRAERRQYDFQLPAPPAQPRGLAVAMLDPLGDAATAPTSGQRVSRVEYDAYAVLPVRTTDALGHATTAQYDYRLLQVRLTTDPNGNRTAYGFSPLGLLHETALLGKENAGEGDIKSEAQPATATSPAQPLTYVASTWLEYDFFAFARRGQPCWVRTTQREQHYTMDPSPTSATLVKTEYSDGFGRLLQTRAQAEEVLFGDATFGDSGLPADPTKPNQPAVGVRNADPDQPNVVVSGWQVYDNKGRVVAKYEPFFSTGFDFVLSETTAKGQRVQMRYDPRGQLMRTINPDGSEQRVVYGTPGPRGLAYLSEFEPTPWETYSYDANDLAPLTHFGQNRAAASHAFTPQSSQVDALGRVVETHDRLEAATPGGPLEEVVIRYTYDIRGNRTKVIDALGRESFAHVYDLHERPVRTQHLEGGWHLAAFDGAGQSLLARSAKQALLLTTSDALGRPTATWARDQAGEALTRRQYLTYGTNPAANTNGQLLEHYDEAGYTHFTAFDFRGNLLEKTWQTLSDEPFTGQWAAASAAGWAALPGGFNPHWDDLSPGGIATRLAPRQYTTTTSYDALNRATQLMLPAEPGRQEARPVLLPSYNRAGELAQVRLDGQLLVQRVAYNARGQRLLLARGNGLLTRYSYEARTFRVQRLRTEGYAIAGLTLSPQSGTVRQDTAYSYDLLGNIIATTERAPQSGVAGTDELDRHFDYDALYRLLTATGRENQAVPARPWAPATRATGASSTTSYTQRYQYDKLGNIQQVRHTGAASFTRQFQYSLPTSQLQAMQVGADTLAYSYDAAGNVTQENGSRSLQWDAASQLRQFATWTGPGAAPTLLAYYLYNADGQRAKKLTQTNEHTWHVTVYTPEGLEHRYEVSGGTRTGEQTVVAVHDGQSRLYQRRSGDALGDQRPAELYTLEDHLNSAVGLVDATGALVGREEYYPFGETSFGDHAQQRYRYNGKELDQESGLYYYGARFYAPWLCRFVSVDPLAAQYAYYSPYQYAGNKPLNSTDIDGLEEAGAKSSPGQGGGGAYEVKHLDTVGSIAKAHNVSLAQLYAANPHLKGHERDLKTKDKLNLPAATKARNLAPKAGADGPSVLDQSVQAAGHLWDRLVQAVSAPAAAPAAPPHPTATRPAAASPARVAPTPKQEQAAPAAPAAPSGASTDRVKQRILTAHSFVDKGYTYKQTTGSKRTSSDLYLDCSEFVLAVFSVTDPEVAKELGGRYGNTTTIQAGIKKLGGGFHSVPLRGDLALWDGHVEIVDQVKGKGVAKGGLLIIGARGSAGVPTVEGDGWLRAAGHFQGKGLDRKGNPREWGMKAIHSGGTFYGYWTPPIR